jgi:hypothetical protein
VCIRAHDSTQMAPVRYRRSVYWYPVAFDRPMEDRPKCATTKPVYSYPGAMKRVSDGSFVFTRMCIRSHDVRTYLGIFGHQDFSLPLEVCICVQRVEFAK